MNLFRIPFTTFVFLVVLFSSTTGQDDPWRNIGPWMGYTHAMAMDNSHPDTVYAATEYGLYKSVDAAETWELLELHPIEINNVVVSQSHPDHILCSSKFKVFQSKDYGHTWDTIFSDTVKVQCLAFNPENPSTILIGSDAQSRLDGWVYESTAKWLYKSLDGGQTWNQLPLSGVDERDRPRKIKYIVIDPSDTAKIYLGNDSYYEGGVYISHDNGASWEVKRLHGSTEEIMALACTPAHYDHHSVFAIVEAGAINREFHISRDSGLNWTEIIVPSTMVLGGNIRDNALYISPDYPEWVYIGADYNNEDRHSSVIAYHIEDQKWYYIMGAPHTYPTSILTCEKVDYLGFRYNGVYKYAAEDTVWHQKQKGMNSGEVFDLAVNPKDPNKVLAAIRSNVARTKNGGETWDLDDRDFSALAISQGDTSFILAGSKPPYYLPYGASFSYYIGYNNGADWTKHQLFSRTGLFDYDYKMWTGDILIFPSDPDRFIFGIDGGGGAGEGIYLTEDGGSSWLANFGTGVSTLAQDPNNKNNIYLGTTGLGYVRRSEEGGKNWQAISPGGQEAFVQSVRDLAVDKNSDVFAATSEGLFKWGGGTTWNQVPGLPPINARAIVIDNHPAVSVYYVGTVEQGIFKSEDGGSTWEGFNKGLATLNITKLEINRSDPRNLYAGTKDGGIWVTKLSETAVYAPTVQDQKAGINVFPNPSNGTFSIISNADSELSGELKIINLLGKVVYTEHRIDIYPGSTRILTLRDMAPGNYILVFTNEKVSINRPLLITRD